MRGPSRRTTYLGLLAVFAASTIAYLLAPRSELLRDAAAIPLVASLCGALYQLLMDVAAHQRQMAKLEAEQSFAVGSASHMANVAFDRHIAFAEEYLSEMFETLGTLWRDGPTEHVAPHADKLFSLRRKHALWLTESLDRTLQSFELELRKMSSAEWLLRTARDLPDRQKQIDEAYAIFANIIGRESLGASDWNGVPLADERAIPHLIAGLRNMLGVEQLTLMRAAIIDRAQRGIAK